MKKGAGRKAIQGVVCVHECCCQELPTTRRIQVLSSSSMYRYLLGLKALFYLIGLTAGAWGKGKHSRHPLDIFQVIPRMGEKKFLGVHRSFLRLTCPKKLDELL